MQKPYCTYTSRTGLRCMDLRDFICEYGAEMEEYYGVCFGGDNQNYPWLGGFDGGEGACIICFVDEEDHKFSSKNKPALRRAGSKRRRKIKHRYSYENPMNRIHGFMFVDGRNNNLTPEDKNILSLSLICSSFFTDKKGVGSDMMNFLLNNAKEVGYTDIILEVANEFSAQGLQHEESEEESEEEDSEEEDSEEELEEEDDEWYPDEEALEIISHELWRKTMRYKDDVPYYNVDKGYIFEHVEEYFYNQDYEKEEKEPNIVSDDEPGENEYGGYWYRKGYNSQVGLIGFYKKFGFVDEPKVHLEWNCYNDVAFPTMLYSL